MIKINKSVCTNCAICYDVCPNYVFQSKDHIVSLRHPEFCNKCAHCIALCRTGALSHENILNSEFQKLSEANISTIDMKNLIHSRRSVRCFKNDLVPNDIIEQLLETAIDAGTSGNLQTEQFKIIQDRKMLDELEILVINTLWNGGVKFFSDNKFMLKILSKKFGPELTSHYHNTHKIIKHRKENNELKGMIFRNTPAVIILHGLKANNLGSINSAIAIRNMELLALTMGLGTCWAGQMISAANMNSKKINEFLSLDKSRKIYGALMIGYPKYKINFKIPRNQRV